MNKNIIFNINNTKHNPHIFLSFNKFKLFTISKPVLNYPLFLEKCKESGITSILIHRKDIILLFNKK